MDLTDEPVTTYKSSRRRRSLPASAHIVDRALVAAALRKDRGWSAARIGRRWRRSRGYGSIVLRLGQALTGMSPMELEVLRAPGITYKVVQRTVRRGMDAQAVRRALVKEISWPTQDGRKRRGKGKADRGQGGLPGWAWDSKLAAEDPLGFLADYATAVHEYHREISSKFRAVLDRSPAPFVALAGQSIASLAASVARAGATAPSLSPVNRQALKRLTELDAYFAELRRGGVSY